MHLVGSYTYCRMFIVTIQLAKSICWHILFPAAPDTRTLLYIQLEKLWLNLVSYGFYSKEEHRMTGFRNRRWVQCLASPHKVQEVTGCSQEIALWGTSYENWSSHSCVAWDWSLVGCYVMSLGIWVYHSLPKRHSIIFHITLILRAWQYIHSSPNTVRAIK